MTAGVTDAEPQPTTGRTVVIAAVAVAAAVLPFVVATARAVATHWLPIGDNALFSIRARDVLTANHPLLGTWTSASITLGRDLNNPGPLEFDLLALPAKLGGPAGLAIGVALVNIAAVLGIAAVAWRRAGAVAVAAAMAVCAALAWTMGSDLLVDPWQPHALLFPFLLLLVLVWGVIDADLVLLPWVVAVASLVVETHLSYALLVGGIGVLAVAGAVLPASRRRHGTASVVRWLGLSAGVGVLCWAQPLLEQLRHGSDGNLAALASTAGGGVPFGARYGFRLVASVLAVPPLWGRDSFRDRFVLLGLARLPGLGAALVGMAVLAALLVAAALAAHRFRDRPSGAAIFLGAAMVGGSLVTAAVLPQSNFLIKVAPHQLRFIWPVAAFTTFALLLTALRRLSATPAAVVAAVLAVVAGAAALPTYHADAGPSADADSLPSVRRLLAQLGPLEHRGPFLVDVHGLRFAEPYSTPVMAELQRRGIPFELDDNGMVHQLGPRRRLRGRVEGRLFLREGDAALEPQDGALVARVTGLDAAERAELDRLRQEVSDDITANGLRLNARGRELVPIHALPTFEAKGASATVRDGVVLRFTGELPLVVHLHLADLSPDRARLLARYVDLEERWSRHTAALFLAPS